MRRIDARVHRRPGLLRAERHARLHGNRAADANPRYAAESRHSGRGRRDGIGDGTDQRAEFGESPCRQRDSNERDRLGLPFVVSGRVEDHLDAELFVGDPRQLEHRHAEQQSPVQDLQQRAPATHVIVDLVGYLATSTTGRFVPLTPVRIVDTRYGNGGRHAPLGGAGTMTVTGSGIFDVPYPAAAVMVGVVPVPSPSTPEDYLTIYPSGAAAEYVQRELQRRSAGAQRRDHESRRRAEQRPGNVAGLQRGRLRGRRDGSARLFLEVAGGLGNVPAMTVLHVRGILLPDEIERDAWLIDGRLTFDRYAGAAETISDRGYVLPGFVDAHCHIGLAPEGHVPDPDGQATQAKRDRDAGALLLRDAGSPVDNTGVQRREDLPRLIRAGRHIARPYRYIRDLGVEVEPDDLVAEVERQAGRGDGWVKLVGDWIDRSTGDLGPVWPDDVLKDAVARAHELGVRVAVHVFGEDALPALITAGVDSIEHGSGLTGGPS